jgi:hypothetical protein
MERPACETDSLWPLYETRLFAIVPSAGSRAALSSPFLLNGYRARVLLALPSHSSDGLGVNVGIGAMVGSGTRKVVLNCVVEGLKSQNRVAGISYR